MVAHAQGLSVNALSGPLVQALIIDADQLRVGVRRLGNGCTLVDAGIDCLGSLEAGRRIATICMAGLGDVRLRSSPLFPRWPWQVEVTTSQPVMACLASQYAGWSLNVEDGKAFQALGSGPGRALATKEPLFQELDYHDASDSTCLVLETDRIPPATLADKVSRDCGVAPDAVTLILTPTGSLAGAVQIAARVVEVALHKAHALGFQIDAIVEGVGSAPLPPPVSDALMAMGRTNDTILFGGQVHLFVTGPDQDAQNLAQRLPSRNSRDYGKPFAQVFADYEYDFFQIDPMLFSPAQISVTALESGRTYYEGGVDLALLERSFGEAI